MISALIMLSGSGLEGLIRMIISRSENYAPDMLDPFLWKVQTVCSILKAATIIAVFITSYKKLLKRKNIVPKEDHAEMGILQREVFGSDLSTLSADDTEQLLMIWGVILGGAECVYYISSIIYRHFTAQLMMMAVLGQQYDSFVPLYNLTHGFKYLEMMTAILLGVAMTAIFLRDRFLGLASGVIMVVFLVAFAALQMQSVGQMVIVWTSVIFHLTETVGLFVLSIYLAKHYRGL